MSQIEIKKKGEEEEEEKETILDICNNLLFLFLLQNERIIPAEHLAFASKFYKINKIPSKRNIRLLKVSKNTTCKYL